MGRKKMENARRKSIGAKVTEESMRELDMIIARLNLQSRTELVILALNDLVFRTSENNGSPQAVTKTEGVESFIRLMFVRTF